jgi:hypothetical protein
MSIYPLDKTQQGRNFDLQKCLGWECAPHLLAGSSSDSRALHHLASSNNSNDSTGENQLPSERGNIAARACSGRRAPHRSESPFHESRRVGSAHDKPTQNYIPGQQNIRQPQMNYIAPVLHSLRLLVLKIFRASYELRTMVEKHLSSFYSITSTLFFSSAL